jgi:ABC-2 type transport system ATP-binding protein
VNVIEIKGLSKEYRSGFTGNKRFSAVDNLDLAVGAGEIYGFLGPNGAGKTTTLKIIMGFLRATSGKVLLFGEDASHWKVRERVGFLPENPNIYPYLTGRQALYIIGKYFSMPHKRIVKRIDELSCELGMERELILPIRKHSRGMAQRIGLAQALINEPDLILLDEPMNGLDPIGRKMFREAILRQREAGRTVFFSSHILSDIEMICTRIGLLNRGRIVLEQPMSEILNRPDGKKLEEIFMEKVSEQS